jgi:hypothetical protein
MSRCRSDGPPAANADVANTRMVDGPIDATSVGAGLSVAGGRRLAIVAYRLGAG